MVNLLKKKLLRHKLKTLLLKQGHIELYVATKGCNVLVTYCMNNIRFSCSYTNLPVFKKQEYYDYFKVFLMEHNIKQSNYEHISNAILEYFLLFNSPIPKMYKIYIKDNSMYLTNCDTYLIPQNEEYININLK